MIYKYRYVIYTAVALLLIAMFTLIFAVFSGSDSAYEFDEKATSLNGVFSTYEGKVYAMVPSNGYYELKGVKAEDFKVLSDNFNDAHIGYDSRNVYAGNLILEGLQPSSVKALGNNYYTDGRVTYYSSRNSERNTSLSALKEIMQMVGEGLGIGNKPQTYWYPAVELPESSSAYQSAKGFGIAVNQQKAFYKGRPLPEADPKNIRPILMRENYREDRESLCYFTDGKRVYYENQLLPLTYQAGVYELSIEGDIPSRNAYLMDENNGMVYVDGHAFDKDKAPYRLLSADLEHANHVLFAAKDGIYFYNAEKEQVKRAGKNPFENNTFEEIAPDVFRSGNKIYYLASGEDWGRKSGLQSRNTHLMVLEDIAAANMRFIGNTGKNTYGNVWQSGNRYFYFDELGSSQLMPQAVYTIKDAAIAKNLATSENIRSDEVRKLRSAGSLLPADSENILTASTDYENKDRKLIFWIVGGCIVLVLLITFLMRNKKIAPFILKEEWLIINNLTFKKYRISEIEKVVFKVVQAKGGYGGKMQVRRNNGKASWFFAFATKVTLMPETEPAVRAYINELQADLDAAGIPNELIH